MGSSDDPAPTIEHRYVLVEDSFAEVTYRYLGSVEVPRAEDRWAGPGARAVTRAGRSDDDRPIINVTNCRRAIQGRGDVSDSATSSDSRPALPWRIVIVFVGSVLLWLFVYHGTPLGDDYNRLTHAARAVLTTVLAVAMVLAARRLLDHRPWTGLGLTSLRTGWHRLLLGVVCWLLPSAIGFALCLGFGWVDIRLRTSTADALQAAVFLPVLVFLYEALPEELVFRGYVQRNLATGLPAWQAVIGQATLFTLFGLLVGAATSLDRILVFFLFALLLGGFRVATGDIWAGIGFHLAFQTVAQMVDSPGAVVDVTGLDVLGLVALGGLPFSVGWIIVQRRYRAHLNWQAREPDPAR